MAGVYTSKNVPNDEEADKLITSKSAQEASRDDKHKHKGVDVELDNIQLTLRKFSFFNDASPIPSPHRTEKHILKGVTTRFQSGQVNVIMGPSGSGKSSLLNLLSSRLPSSTGSFTTSGSLLVDGSPVKPEELQAVCSYVTQDDSALLPYLTVREMLRFAAGLRLPKGMSRKEKRKRAEDVIRSMGLSDCADNLVGGEFVKGISGGEKRRVSIGVQLLTEPRVLMCVSFTSPSFLCRSFVLSYYIFFVAPTNPPRD